VLHFNEEAGMHDGVGVRRWRQTGACVGVALAALAAVGAAPQDGDADYLPLALFGIVVFCVLPLLLAYFSLRRRPSREADCGMHYVPSRLPVDLAAVHERAPTNREQNGAAASEPADGIRADLPAPRPPERPRSVPPGGAAARCSKCRWVIIPDGVPRLWCPRCGADLKLVFDEVKPEIPGSAAP
jgi:hypothetical protein